MAPRVLVSDRLSETAVQIFRDRGIDVDYKPDLGKDKDALLAAIPAYDGLAIRSATKVTPKIIAAATRLKVIGRAGIGVDNVDIPAATGARHRGDEHALRQCHHHGGTCALHDDGAGPADSRGQCFDPCRQVGEEPLHGGRAVQQDAGRSSAAAISAPSSPTGRIGLKMKVIAYDPFLSPERAIAIGVEKVELDDIFQPLGFHHAAYAADRQDAQHHRCRGAGQMQARVCASSIAPAAA